MVTERQLTRDEATPCLIYKGPVTRYNEDVVAVCRKEQYRPIDSRFLSKAFTKKMQGIETITKKKMMVVEGKDVKLFTVKPKETKVIPKAPGERAIEANEAIAELVKQLTTGGADNSELLKELKELKAENEKLKKGSK